MLNMSSTYNEAIKQLSDISNISDSASSNLNALNQVKYSQYFTPAAIANQIARMIPPCENAVIGDYGAGAGILSGTAAILQAALHNTPYSKVHAFEIDKDLHVFIEKTISKVADYYGDNKHKAPSLELNGDFLEGVGRLLESSTIKPSSLVDTIILNPPYKKLGKQTEVGKKLTAAGINVPNIYALFIMISMTWLKPGGYMVAIVPRSFTNGRYFKEFRYWLRKHTSLDWVVRYKGRSNLFKRDNVLQENVIIRLQKEVPQSEQVRVTICPDAESDPTMDHLISSSTMMQENEGAMLFVPANEKELLAMEVIANNPCKLSDLGLAVSTGKIEEFRYREWLSNTKHSDHVPLLYSGHWERGNTKIQSLGNKIGKKNPYLKINDKTIKKILPKGAYVVLKRISANDDDGGRVHAALLPPEVIKSEGVAIENHVQYFHSNGKGINPELASGLVRFLSSDPVEYMMRAVSGTTQLNVSDLEQLRFPLKEELIALS